MRHLLAIRDLLADDLRQILDLSEAPYSRAIHNKGVALYFEKPSARTRNSMELAAAQLGGHPVYLQPNELGRHSRTARIHTGHCADSLPSSACSLRDHAGGRRNLPRSV